MAWFTELALSAQTAYAQPFDATGIGVIALGSMFHFEHHCVAGLATPAKAYAAFSRGLH